MKLDTIKASDVKITALPKMHTQFERWRFWCPYGCWTCADGREVLFNRTYHPIYERYAKQPARVVPDHCKWVPWVAMKHFFQRRQLSGVVVGCPGREVAAGGVQHQRSAGGVGLAAATTPPA
jgi:hypothetical protein